MKISDVVRGKGSSVITIRSDDTVEHLLSVLAEHGIGALVVSDDGESVDGIVSERDVVRRLHQEGATMLTGPVRAIMTADVHTCGLDDQLDSIESTMTQRRIRHVPVVTDGKLAAIISIGDVVKNRIEHLQSERDALVEYINQ